MLQPKRETEVLSSGDVIVTVTPPEWSGFKGSSITLTAKQYQRYQEWLNSKDVLIQHKLPELTPAQREILMSGISSEEWEDKVAVNED